MNHTIETLHEAANLEVTLQGWVRHVRSSGKLHFITLRDGTGDVQCRIHSSLFW